MNDPAWNRLYEDLAWLWPMWGNPETEYARYCDYVAGLIGKYARRPVNSLLNIACGGGKNACNLKRRFRLTGLDASERMLELARNLNPDCLFVRDDMRSFQLGQTFDAVLLDDGISYMTSRADLLAAFRAAYEHLAAGGVMVVTADTTAETFRQNRTTTAEAAGKAKPEDIDVVFVENVFDPDPSDEHYEATMLFLIRERGVLRIESDRHLLGLFSLETWRQTLTESRFEIHEEQYAEDGDAYTCFACVKSA